MRLPLLFSLVTVLVVISSLAVNAASVSTSIEIALSTEANRNEIRQVIETMNRAVSERNLPVLLSTFADGSIKVDLFPAHKYSAAATEEGDAVKTVKLDERWQSVAPILFATTKIYDRKVKIREVLIDKGMAVAWLDIETKTLSVKEGASIKYNRFKEICILRHYDQGWKIVALTNNRHDLAL